MDERIKKYLPEHVNLYYVDYCSDLKEQITLLQDCIDTNSLIPLNDILDDWWYHPTEDYMKDIRIDMKNAGLEELFHEHYIDIEDWLFGHDESTPVEDLLRNTGSVTCYYDLGVELDCGWHYAFLAKPWRNESVAQCANKIRRKLGVKNGSADDKKIREMLESCTCGGSLRIYFPGHIENLISDHKYAEKTEKDDFKQIIFDGEVALAVYNPTEGAGDFCYISLNHSFQFVRENLVVSEIDKYDLESCFGMCGDWLDRCVEPTFSMLASRKKTNASKSAELRKHEAELDAIYKAGGCTAGDMDMRRHRGVYYDNNIPCGHHCPHCGTFWID